MNLIRIAWRNLWRNKRRTLITISSILFGVLFASMMYSLEEGSYGNMIDNVVRLSSGYLNIQQKDFRETQSLNDSFVPGEPLLSALRHTGGITLISARLQSAALASSGEKSFPVMVMGIEPGKEEEMSHITRWVHRGHFLHNDDHGVVVGSALAENLHISCGDSLVLIGQGYHGTSAAGVFPVTGIASLPFPVLNRQLVYMPLTLCQTFYNMENHITSIMIMLPDYDRLASVQKQLEPAIPSGLTLYNWKDLNPELVQFVEGKTASGNIFMGILFMIIGFGILGTLIMVLTERKRELGVMMALGMRRTKISAMVFSETIFLGLWGILAGFLISVPLILYLIHYPIQITGTMRETFLQMGFEPVILFSLKPYVFYTPVIIVFIITLFVSLYIFYAIFKLKAREAISG